jgi:hypothetical protein
MDLKTPLVDLGTPNAFIAKRNIECYPSYGNMLEKED